MHFKASLVTESYNCIFYVVLISVMYVRLHETFDLETLRNQSHLEELVSRSCHENNAVHSLKQVKKLTAGEKWVNFAMVREPEERFLSGFLFMCTPNNTVSSKCEGCINDIECALKTTIDHARRFAAGELSATSFLLWHLGPQNWHCHFQKDKRMQVFKYSPTEKKKTLKDITTILEAIMGLYNNAFQLLYWDYIMFDYPLPSI
ncbi:unnamed protein product [Nippostrongylus brasiliensis]|uniref:Gnk2-homologous domain-containing protein n=1 Tax=Nippostrongylus brasiliensis TaxID=27835 RepID=A0A0N4YEV6_NIPBR|nr:unnamed protein product [Nippostrongylus brasiliensis]